LRLTPHHIVMRLPGCASGLVQRLSQVMSRRYCRG